MGIAAWWVHKTGAPIRSENLRQAFRFTAWSVAIGLAPFWVGAAALQASGTGAAADLFRDGQLILAAATTAGTAAYVASLDREGAAFGFRSWIMLGSFVLALLAPAIYVAALVSGTRETFDETFVIWASVASYATAMTLAAFAELMDAVRYDQVRQISDERIRSDYQEKRTESEDKLRIIARDLQGVDDE